MYIHILVLVWIRALALQAFEERLEEERDLARISDLQLPLRASDAELAETGRARRSISSAERGHRQNAA